MMLKFKESAIPSKYEGAISYALGSLERELNECLCEKADSIVKLSFEKNQIHLLIPDVAPEQTSCEVYFDTKNDRYYMSIAAQLEDGFAVALGFDSPTTHLMVAEGSKVGFDEMVDGLKNGNPETVITALDAVRVHKLLETLARGDVLSV